MGEITFEDFLRSQNVPEFYLSKLKEINQGQRLVMIQGRSYGKDNFIKSYRKFLEVILHTGVVIRFKNDEVRDWILIHQDDCGELSIPFSRSRSSNYLPFMILGGLWYEGDPLTSKPYGKIAGQLTMGALNNIIIVGDINNSSDLDLYKSTGHVYHSKNP